MSSIPLSHEQALVRTPARHNPFSVQRLAAAPVFIDDAAWTMLWRRFDEAGRRGAIVGPHGAGKTTLILRRVIPELEKRGFHVRYHHVSTDNPRLPPAFLFDVGPDDAVIIDATEKLSWIAWQAARRRLRRAGAVLITMHVPGRLPTLIEHRGSAARLAQIVRTVVQDRNLAHWNSRLRALMSESPGDMRTALRALYDEASGIDAGVGADSVMGDPAAKALST